MSQLRPLRSHLEPYLQATEVVDYETSLVTEQIKYFKDQKLEELDVIKAIFEFVRDEIDHSFDIESQRLTCKASEVLKYREGICYAKAHLMVALLRGCGIASGFCYQTLRLEDELAPELILHGLVGVYSQHLKRWFRLDPRGNKPGVDAQFDYDKEQLAFLVRPHLGEWEDFICYDTPDANVLKSLESAPHAGALFSNLPKKLSREIWDVYDEKRQLTGALTVRGEGMPSGGYHLVVHVWIRNAKGHYLISKRTANKTFPLMWESTGGSVVMGEDSLTGALREVEEEIGLTLDPLRGRRLRSDLRGDNFRDVWLFEQEADLKQLSFQAEEVCDARWATPQAIRAMIQRGEFISHFTYLEEVFAWQSEQ